MGSETQEMHASESSVDPQGLRRLLGFIALAVLCAVSFGLVVITATVLAVDALRTSSYGNLDLTFSLLVIGTLSGVLLASFSAWRLLAPLGSVYRKGGLSIVAGFATVLLMLVCIPVNQLLGRSGLGVLLMLFGVAAWGLSRSLRRWGLSA